MLWPVFLWSAVQGDHVRLFELGDVVTLPVELVDAATQTGWPTDIGVETTVTVDQDQRRGWATTSTGLSVRTHLPASDGIGLPVRAGLTVEFHTSALMSFVTGTVRRIELASVRSPPRGDPAEPLRSDERWTLTETPVAPVAFRTPLGPRPSPVWDQGILIHLELFRPHCRCTEIDGLQARDASDYAHRHLHATAERHYPEVVEYVCPDTGINWLWHQWKRKRYLNDPALGVVPYESMILTKQPRHPDLPINEPPGEVVQIALDELTGSFRDIAQLTADGVSDLNRAGIELAPTQPDSVGPARAAAIQLSDGSQYLLVQHLGHPDQFIDIRATTDIPTSRRTAQRLLVKLAVPEANVLWLHDRWPA